jgi:hypothetical protein
VTDVHAEHERRSGETYGYQQPHEDYEPSDTGYDPAVDGPEDVTDREPRTTEQGTGPDDQVAGTIEDAEVVEDDTDSRPVDEDARREEDAYADATPIGTPYGTPVPPSSTDQAEGALPEDVVAADAVTSTGTAETVEADDDYGVSAADTAAVATVGATGATGSPSELVDNPDALMARWQQVQVSFVDDPAEALRDADGLVQQVIEQMRERFLAERAEMEQQWSSGDDVSTEDMRLLLQKYRTFFNRLIKV